MTWQDDQKRVATGVTDGTDGRKYSTVFPYEPKPVAWGWDAGGGHIIDVITPEEHARVEGQYMIPLYTSPPRRSRVEDDDDIQDYKRPWVGLTNNELQPICDEYRIIFGSWAEDFARAIEAKLKEKNA